MRACKCFCWVAIGLLAVGTASVQADVEFSMIPLQDSAGVGTIVGNEILLAEGDTTVEVECYVGNWASVDPAKTVKGWQTRLDCAGYSSGDVGTLTAVADDFTLFGYEPYKMGINKAHTNLDNGDPDYIYHAFPGDFAACAVADECSPGVLGRFSCLSGSLLPGPLDPVEAGESYTDYYLNTYSFIVPPEARGTFTVNLNIATEESSIRDADQIPIVPANFSPVLITVVAGACCGHPSAPLGCADGLLESECDLVGGGFFAGDVCSGVDDNGDDLDDFCPICELGDDTTCADGNACTIDVCTAGGCDHTEIAIGADQCCDPDTGGNVNTDIMGGGSLANNDDGDDCTDNLCSDGGQIGLPVNPPSAAGTPCDDDNGCSTADVCDGAGLCAGTDINTIPCGDPAECVFPETDPGVCEDGFCVCNLATALTLDIDDEDCCFDEGAPVVVEVNMGGGSQVVTGAQFLVTYDPACIEFVGWENGTEFPLVLFEEIDEVAGTIFLALGVEPFGPPPVGTQGPALLSTLTFTKLGACTDPCELCFDSQNPYNTILTNDEGEPVMTEQFCSCPIDLDGTAHLNIPDSEYIHSDCMMATAVYYWDAPSASDDCDGPIDLDGLCYAVSHDPLWKCTLTGRICDEFANPDDCASNGEGICMEEAPMPQEDLDNLLANNGGEFAQGVSTFCCTVESEEFCAGRMHDCWTVEVSDKNAMDVIVELSPVMTPGALTRCIEFGFYWDCVRPPTMWQENLAFGPPYDFAGKSTPIILVQKGQYMCLTAQDPLHTVRSVSSIDCDEATGMLTAAFHFEPPEGNWLINGNLSGNDVIDIVDFGLFVSQYMMVLDPDTPCGMAGPHADINGDGIVDSSDFAFIAMNYLTSSKNSCCEDGTALAPTPITEISVKELREMGLGHLVVADLNGDGMVNGDDMASFMAGQAPSKPEIKRGTSRPSLR